MQQFDFSHTPEASHTFLTQTTFNSNSDDTDGWAPVSDALYNNVWLLSLCGIPLNLLCRFHYPASATWTTINLIPPIHALTHVLLDLVPITPHMRWHLVMIFVPCLCLSQQHLIFIFPCHPNTHCLPRKYRTFLIWIICHLCGVWMMSWQLIWKARNVRLRRLWTNPPKPNMCHLLLHGGYQIFLIWIIHFRLHGVSKIIPLMSCQPIQRARNTVLRRSQTNPPKPSPAGKPLQLLWEACCQETKEGWAKTSRKEGGQVWLKQRP